MPFDRPFSISYFSGNLAIKSLLVGKIKENENREKGDSPKASSPIGSIMNGLGV